MKKRKSAIGLGLVTAMLLGSSAYAGKIITDADVTNIDVLPNTQFGFGGWNFDNVDVRIVNIADFSTALPDTFFDTLDGEYSPMGVDESFESDIWNADRTEIMGHLHGKDWPVGEPAGIKIINDDDKVSHGKPVNCIMTSSYLETGYLDADIPNPTLCSSPFQSHKRYKINLLPSTVANVAEGAVGEAAYGEPVDLVFILDESDTDTVARRYQVLQKVNNYTDVRLDGYKVEVLDENGEPNAALTLSLGIGEGTDDDGIPDPLVDIWAENELANYSHGLWGPYQKVGNVVRFDNGFFDWIRSYYPAKLSSSEGTTVENTISYAGDMMGGNYQEIFGNWLPSIWAPTGIFHDDDMDPATDGILKTFFGIAPGKAELAWWTRTVVDLTPNDDVDPVYTWVQATAEELAEWEGEWYEEGDVEDVLNLGLNYIINVGENAEIGATFTLRLTPHVAADQTPPSYVDADPTDPNVAPTADAGDDQSVQVGTPITITGSGTDTDGTIESYVWSETSKNGKDTYILAEVKVNEPAPALEFDFLYTPTSLGVHTLTLTVTDNDGATGTDTMIVKVKKNAPNVPQGPKTK